MKKLLFGLLFASVALGAAAQEKESSTLRPEAAEDQEASERRIDGSGLMRIATDREVQRHKRWHEDYQQRAEKGKHYERFRWKSRDLEDFQADARKEFDRTMSRNDKRYRQMERMAEKPQYSDPSYLGHKRPPKKRAPGKQRYCKECGLVH